MLSLEHTLLYTRRKSLQPLGFACLLSARQARAVLSAGAGCKSLQPLGFACLLSAPQARAVLSRLAQDAKVCSLCVSRVCCLHPRRALHSRLAQDAKVSSLCISGVYCLQKSPYCAQRRPWHLLQCGVQVWGRHAGWCMEAYIAACCGCIGDIPMGTADCGANACTGTIGGAPVAPACAYAGA